MKNKVTVSIAGHEYTMVAAEDEAYVRKVAAHVDAQIREVMEQGGRLSLTDVSVLAALNIADQYFREQAALNIADQYFREQAASENIRRQIKECLEESARLKNELSECKREIFKLQNRK